MSTINPYLTFDGTCEAAFEFYKSVFQKEFDYFERFKNMPSQDGQQIPEDIGEKVMHVSLQISKETILMGCDANPLMGQEVKNGNNISISISTGSEEEAKTLFDGLSDGGQIAMPLEKTFWGALFGMFIDKFGINWMVNYSYEQ